MFNIVLIVVTIIAAVFGLFLAVAFFALYKVRKDGLQSKFFTGFAVSMVALLGFFRHVSPKNSKEVAMQTKKQVKELE